MTESAVRSSGPENLSRVFLDPKKSHSVKRWVLFVICRGTILRGSSQMFLGRLHAD